MGFRDWITRDLQTRIEAYDLEIADLKASLSTEKQRLRTFQAEIKSRRRTLPATLRYATRNTDGSSRKDRGNSKVYYGPLHDLSEIARAVDIEPYISISIRKHREQILKDGFVIKGQDKEMVSYIKKRLFEMFLVSGVTTEQWVREFVTQLVMYGTGLLVVRRDVDKSTGDKIRLHGKSLDPTAAVFPMDPTSVKANLNSKRHVTSWMQKINESATNKYEEVFPSSDVVVATIDKKTGFVFGTPYVLPVLDDVRALRRIEEIAEIIGQKHAFPIIHWRVGEKEDPPVDFEDGTTELDVVKAEVENMPLEGGIVTSYRVDSETMGAANKVIDLVPYLEYFERRVMGGLRLAAEDLGRSESNKASAVTASQSLQDSSKDFQAVIADAVTYQLFVPLLLEGGYNVTEETLVHMTFPLINREEERSRQSHATDMFGMGVMTRSEVRKEFLGKDELDDEETQDCKPEMNHERDLELAKLAAAAKAANSASRGTASAANTTANKTRPSNQSGKKPAKTRVKANDIHKEMYGYAINAEFRDCQNMIREFISKHGVGVNSEDDEDKLDLTTKDQELRSILDSFVTLSVIEARKLMNPVLVDGMSTSLEDMKLEGQFSIPKRTLDRFFKNTIEKSFKKLSTNIYNAIFQSEDLWSKDKKDPLVVLGGIFDIMRVRLNSLCDSQIDLAYRFAYTRAAKAHGYMTVTLSPEDEESESKPIEVSLVAKDIPYNILLSSPDNQDYSISLGEKNLEAE